MNIELYKKLIKELILNREVNIYDDDVGGSYKGQINYICQKYQLTTVEEKSKVSIYKYNDLIGIFNGMKPHTTTSTAFAICQNKYLTNKWLEKNGVSVVKSNVFKADELEEARKYIGERLKTSFVVKPYNLSGGRGITANIQLDFLEEAWDFSLQEQKKKKVKVLKNIVEEFKPGVDIRIVVVDGKFNCAALRIPAHVIGDGKLTIMELIEEKNKVRIKNPYLQNKLIELNEHGIKLLRNQNINPSDILEEGKVVILHEKANVLMGGDNIDITDRIPESVKKFVEKTVRVMPGLSTAGIDVIVDSINNFENPVVIEVNTNANLMLNQFPLIGTQRTPLEDVIISMLKDYNIFGCLHKSGLLDAINFPSNRKNQEINNLKKINKKISSEKKALLDKMYNLETEFAQTKEINNQLENKLQDLNKRTREYEEKYRQLSSTFPFNIINKFKRK